jgi:hypothetical protein
MNVSERFPGRIYQQQDATDVLECFHDQLTKVTKEPRKPAEDKQRSIKSREFMEGSRIVTLTSIC